MRTLRSLMGKKLADEAFKSFYDGNCTICSFTVNIFAELHERRISLDELAEELGINGAELRDLSEAEHCDPAQVRLICRWLNLPVPGACPQLKS